MRDNVMPQAGEPIAEEDLKLFRDRLQDLESRVADDSYSTGSSMVFGNTGLEYAYVTCRIAADLVHLLQTLREISPDTPVYEEAQYWGRVHQYKLELIVNSWQERYGIPAYDLFPVKAANEFGVWSDPD